MGFPLEKDSEMPYQNHNRLAISWGTKDGNGWLERYWTYSLKLTKLNTTSDLKLNVTDPVIKLLKGEKLIQL